MPPPVPRPSPGGGGTSLPVWRGQEESDVIAMPPSPPPPSLELAGDGEQPVLPSLPPVGAPLWAPPPPEVMAQPPLSPEEFQEMEQLVDEQLAETAPTLVGVQDFAEVRQVEEEAITEVLREEVHELNGACVPREDIVSALGGAVRTRAVWPEGGAIRHRRAIIVTGLALPADEEAEADGSPPPLDKPTPGAAPLSPGAGTRPSRRRRGRPSTDAERPSVVEVVEVTPQAGAAPGARPMGTLALGIADRVAELGAVSPPLCDEPERQGHTGRRALRFRMLQEHPPGGAQEPVVVYEFLAPSSNASSAGEDWNPEASSNWWPRDADDGSSAFLEPYVDMEARAKLYVNFVYTIRMANEAVVSQGVALSLGSLFWAQGSLGTPGTRWEVLTEMHIRLFSQLRVDLGMPDLPIVDVAAGTEDAVHTAAEESAEMLGNVSVVHFALGEGTQVDVSCRPSAVSLCGRVPLDLQRFYGRDQCDPSVRALNLTEGETFEWFASCDSTVPGADASQLVGNMLTEAYIMNMRAAHLGGREEAPGFSYEELGVQVPLHNSTTLRTCTSAEEIWDRGAHSWCWADLRVVEEEVMPTAEDLPFGSVLGPVFPASVAAAPPSIPVDP